MPVLLGATIGYGTNVMAIQLVFRWLIPRKSAELKNEAIKTILYYLPIYLKLPIVREIVEENIRTNVEMEGVEKLGKRIYKAGGKEQRFIELTGALVGALVGIILTFGGG